MCGIIGVALNKYSLKVVKNLFDLFAEQEKRGIDGAGISISNENEFFRFRSHSPFRVFNAYNYPIWEKIDNESRVIFHHRLPSSTENKPKFNHPLADENDVIHVAHNGVISNYKALYEDLKKRHKFKTEVKDKKNNISFTDSEVIVHLLEEYLENMDIVSALNELYYRLTGQFAIALQIKNDKNIYLIRQERPLIVSKDSKDNYYFSSEFTKINDLKKVYELKEGEIGILDNEGYEILVKNPASTNYYNAYDNTLSYYTNFGNKQEPKETIKNSKKKTKTKINQDLVNFVTETKMEILSERPNIDFSRLCLKVYSAIDDYDSELDIENNKVREAVRQIIEYGYVIS